MVRESSLWRAHVHVATQAIMRAAWRTLPCRATTTADSHHYTSCGGDEREVVSAVYSQIPVTSGPCKISVPVTFVDKPIGQAGNPAAPRAESTVSTMSQRAEVARDDAVMHPERSLSSTEARSGRRWWPVQRCEDCI